MDITGIFKACLETLRQKNKELAFINPTDKNGTSIGVAKIFPGKKSENFSKARELSTTISSLRDYLYENRNAYLNITASTSTTPHGGQGQGAHSSVFGSGGGKRGRIPVMTDMDRDLLDNDVQKIIHNCQKRILDYEKLIDTTDCIKDNPYVRTHMESVSESLTGYLKQVTTVFSEMRAIRMKRTIDYKNMSRLSSIDGALNKRNFLKSSSSKETAIGSTPLQKRNSLAPHEAEEIDGSSSGKSPTVPDYFLDEGDIPPEELQLLEEENAALLNQLNSLAQEVDQIQSNVVQIAQLQEIFTEKVLQQEKDIDIIGSVVVGATENIKGGNEQLRQAIQKNADFRVWVLFFILVMSFSLLFLDWYND